MKKNISFSKRVLSMMLVLLLCMGTVAIGIPTVAAKDYTEGERVFINHLEIGEKLEKGVTIINLNPNNNKKDYKAFSIYIDGELYQEAEDKITVDRPVTVTDKTLRRQFPIQAEIYLETEKAEAEPTTEAPKRVYLNDLDLDDFLDKETTIVNLNPDKNKKEYKKFSVYLDGELYREAEDEITINRPVVVTDKTLRRQFPVQPEIYLETFEEENIVDSQKALQLALKGSQIDLSGSIELTEELRVNDGKDHVINTNGYSITQKVLGPSVISVTDGSSLTIIGSGEEGTSTLSGGDNELVGGAIRVLGNSKLVMKEMNITDNKAQFGGGIRVESSTVELTKCTLKNNVAYKNGGAVYIDENSTATLTDCEIINNEAHDGGGIANLGTLTVDNCKLNGNAVRDNGGGGGIWSKGDATITKTEITQNVNAVNGGGVTNHKNMTLTDCTISANKAENKGGGIFIEAPGSNTVIDGGSVENNVGKVGAGIHLRKGDLTVKRTTLNSNLSGEAGGALWANSGTTAAFSDAKMSNNTCKTNGGCLNSHGAVSLNRCTIDGCSANNCGGGIYMDSTDTLTVQASEITNCMSVTGGAGVHFHSGSLILMGGKTRITDSTTGGNSSNVYFRILQPIQIQGRLYSGSAIGLTLPSDVNGVNATSGFGQNNEGAPADIFFCDNNQYKINRGDGVEEVNLIETMQASDRTGYSVKVEITVTDDVDTWKSAIFRIKGKADRGLGAEKELNVSPNFESSVDAEGKSYSYEYDCGSEYFPSTIEFESEWGDVFPRDFEADVTVHINGINVASRHIVQEGTGRKTRTSAIDIGGDKYPYPVPEAFEVDMPKEIDSTGVITVAAVDQYGLKWTAKGENVTMENASFPGEDTIESVDESGFKWKVSSTHKNNHHSIYKMTFKSGSNVYPTITKTINVKFIFLLHLSVIVNDEEVFEVSDYANKTVHFEDIKVPTGYYITEFDNEDRGILEDLSTTDEETGIRKYSYDFTFVNDSVTLTAALSPVNYYLKFDKNAVVVDEKTGKIKKNKGVKGYINNTTLYYDQPQQIPKNNLSRKGYTLVGWNTQPDGMGTMYAIDATVVNLSSKKNDVVYLYAIWKPNGSASTTASIFSDSSVLIYIGIGILIVSIAAAVFYYRKKKREGKEQTVDEA